MRVYRRLCIRLSFLVFILFILIKFTTIIINKEQTISSLHHHHPKPTDKQSNTKTKNENKENFNSPGEMGKAVVINDSQMTPAEITLRKELFETYQFDEFVSQKISLRRQLPDYRDKKCHQLYSPRRLPTTSVIIVFYNEAWSVLLRTIYSVLDRSPQELIHEIILVDDGSTFEHLHKQLDEFVANMAKVQLLRTPLRQGIIRARLLGASKATGDVLTFLDSHCECTQGWLEHLLHPIAENYTNVVVPSIETINFNNFEISTPSFEKFFIGGFDWNLYFDWHEATKQDLANRSSPVAPIRTPTIPGGLFSMDRKYFEYLGSYDKEMLVWGGESIELSFRIWMCGGTLLYAPCSIVGHVFRNKSPRDDSIVVRNDKVRNNIHRLADLWLDEYKVFYYSFQLDKVNSSDVSSRKLLREKLGCKSFSWYLKNIFPSQFDPAMSLFIGQIKSELSPFNCLHTFDQDSRKVNIFYCQEQVFIVNQIFYLSNTNNLRHLKTCLTYKENEDQILMKKCNSEANQIWLREKKFSCKCRNNEMFSC